MHRAASRRDVRVALAAVLGAIALAACESSEASGSDADASHALADAEVDECAAPSGELREIKVKATTVDGKDFLRAGLKRSSGHAEVERSSGMATRLVLRDTQDTFEFTTSDGLGLGLEAGDVVQLDAESVEAGFEGDSHYYLVLRKAVAAAESELVLAMYRSSGTLLNSFERAVDVSIEVTEGCTYEGTTGCTSGTTTLFDVELKADTATTLRSKEHGSIAVDGKLLQVNVHEASRNDGGGCWYWGTLELVLLPQE